MEESPESSLEPMEKAFSSLRGQEMYWALRKLHQFYFPNAGFPLFDNGYTQLLINDERVRQYNDRRKIKKAAEQDILGDTVDQVALNAAKEVLQQEYKFHLMPRDKYVFPILERLLELLGSNESLRNDISWVKIQSPFTPNGSLKDEPSTDSVLPTIVVYPAIGKESAQRVLDTLYSQLHAYARYGEGKIPRYNARIDDLLFYAQGDGDLKDMIKERGDSRLLGLYEKDLVLFRGGESLHIPNTQDVADIGLASSRAAVSDILGKEA